MKEGLGDQLLVYTGVDAAGRGGGGSGGFDLAEGAASIAVASAHAIQDWGMKAKETAKEWMSTRVLAIKKTGGQNHLSIKKWYGNLVESLYRGRRNFRLMNFLFFSLLLFRFLLCACNLSSWSPVSETRPSQRL